VQSANHDKAKTDPPDNHPGTLLGLKVMSVWIELSGAIENLPLPDPPWFPLEEKRAKHRHIFQWKKRDFSRGVKWGSGRGQLQSGPHNTRVIF
jgi:hypothetical protein